MSEIPVESTQEYYFKATMEGGRSASHYKPEIIYHLGLNVHPCPNTKSQEECEAGIHLAKTLKAAKSNVPGAKEYYQARAGVILGEGEDKVRCAYVWIDKQLTADDIAYIEHQEPIEEQRQKQLKKIRLGCTEPLCGTDWLQAHFGDHTQEEIDRQSLVVTVGEHTTTLTARVRPKDIRAVMGVIKHRAA